MSNPIENYLPINLPSKCLPYDGISPEDVKIRAYCGRDEIFLAEINQFNLAQKYLQVMKNVITGIDPEILTLDDRLYVMVWEYAKSYSNTLNAKTMCSHCMKDVVAVVDLTELDVIEIPDDFKQPCEVSLPMSGNIIKLRLFNVRDEIESEKFEKDNDDGFLYRIARTIVDDSDILSRIEKLRSMNAKDVAKIRAFQQKFGHGPDMNTTFKCPSCGEVDNIELPFRLEHIFPDGETLASIVGA